MKNANGENVGENEISDEELVRLFRNGDKYAGERLLVRYKNRVLATARRFFLSGGETEDLVQEGMCGLYSAMVNYSENGASFSTYAYACIRNRILDAVKAGNSAKNSALNRFMPISETESAQYLAERNPEDELINSESGTEFLSELKNILSPFEYKVIVMYTDGLTMAEISSATGRSGKSVDNAVTRAKRKLQAKISKKGKAEE